MNLERRCSTCGVQKPLDMFTWRKDTARYTPRCSTCLKLHRHVRYLTHKTEVYKANKKWRLKNRERYNAYWRRYKQRHPDYVRRAALKWAANNPDALLTYNRSFVPLTSQVIDREAVTDHAASDNAP